MNPIVAAIGLLEFFTVLAGALLLAKKHTRDKDLPRVAVLSAGIFVAQMVNFPVGGGTTGHLIGGALFAILAGPTVAIVGMTAVLLIQALMFGDGGITALGLNAVNMAIIAPLSGWGVYALLKPVFAPARRAGEGLAVGLAAWASVFLAAAVCAAELSVSFAVSGGIYGISANIAVPAMLGYHAVIGIGEAVLTVGILAYIGTVSPEIRFGGRETATLKRRFGRLAASRTAQATVAILIVFAAAMPFYFLYASEGKDGLEQTMADSGIVDGGAILSTPFSYGQNYFAALFAGIVGFLTVSLSTLGILKLAANMRQEG